jgi:sarcosine oxidase subunit gamma
MSSLYASPGSPAAPAAGAVGIRDLSSLPRTGLKGAGAAELLRASGITVPERHNQWVSHLGGLVLRLGYTEYLLESTAENEWTAPIDESARLASQVVPVLRQDTSLLLFGPRVHDLLAQVCSFDFESLTDSPYEVVMTQMIGVSIIVLHAAAQPVPTYRIWCDPSFGDYLLHTLEQIAREQAP